ncbi:unnamed protein product [Meloidogyne enterolobii]|uniref:Uncharacterized protein n=1 Tax=Meloidogyne enterolobii TaxID=390850 RepID=A0ACB0XUB3_MELEN
MEINPNNIIGLLSQVFPDSNNKTPVNSTERKLAQSLAAAINNWKEVDEVGEEVLEEVAELNDNLEEEELLSIEDDLSEDSTKQEEAIEDEDSGDVEAFAEEISNQKEEESEHDLDETASLNENNGEDDSLSMAGNLSVTSTKQEEPNEDENRDDVGIFRSFETMGLKSELLRGIYSYGFEKPAAIQQRVIKQFIIGRDIIALSPPGTGKTASFCIGLLQSICMYHRETQALVLAHTRDGAVNIQKAILAIGDYLDVQCHACVGGTNIHEDRRKLDYGQHIVTGTPGRVFDMIRRRNLRTRSIKLLVIDEADELLGNSFREQVIFVCSKSTPDLDEMATRLMTVPVRIVIKSDINECAQFYINANPKEWKPDILFDLVDLMDATPIVNMLKETTGDEANCFCLHSGLKRNERVEIIKKFRESDERFVMVKKFLFLFSWNRDGTSAK